MQLVSNVLFVIENITLILLSYFSNFPHTWYSLPVTICLFICCSWSRNETYLLLFLI